MKNMNSNRLVQTFFKRLAVFGALSLAGCNSDPSDPGTLSNPSKDPGAAWTDDHPGPPHDEVQRTTPGATALSNLDARISGLETRLERTPGDVSTALLLGDLLLTRAQFAGTFDDLARADELADSLQDLAPIDSRVRSFAASSLSAVHEFGRAKELLGSNLPPLFLLATGGDLTSAYDEASLRAQHFANFETLSTLASVQAARGQFTEADALYVEALQAYRDVSPLPVAWVYFQRGVMWGEMADQPRLAIGMYREAVRRLPGYVVANVHLAELEWQTGDVKSAKARLQRLLSGPSTDPEPQGLLAELVVSEEPEQAAALTKAAKSRYEELFSSFPLAFLDHGAEFFAGPGGDPARALGLSLENLANRRNARSYLVAIEAALAASDPSKACELSAEAKAHDFQNVNLQVLLASLKCG